MSKEIEEYILKGLRDGHQEKEIRSSLQEAGWDDAEIEESFELANSKLEKSPKGSLDLPLPPKKKRHRFDLKNISASQVLLYLGGLIVVIAGITFVGTNWNRWGSFSRIMSITLPMLLCYAVGTSTWTKKEFKLNSIAFLVCAGLLFPLALSVVFRELNLFEDSKGFVMSISFLSLAMYLLSYSTYKHSVWILLAEVAALTAYVTMLDVLGIEKLLGDKAVSWLALVPGAAFLYLSIIFQKNKQQMESHYSYLVGAVVFFFVTLLLLFDPSSLEIFALIALGAGGFYLAANMEKNELSEYSRTIYILASLTIIFSSIQLAVPDMILNRIFGYTGLAPEEVQTWALVFIGAMHIWIGYLITNLKKIGLAQAARMKSLFEFFASIIILFSFFYMGFDLGKTFYDVLLVLASLGFIFGSIPALSKPFLYTGTFFLIIQIFSIGDRYFSDSVGWPMTLFVTGLMSMGVGLYMDKIKRKYFKKKQNKNNPSKSFTEKNQT